MIPALARFSILIFTGIALPIVCLVIGAYSLAIAIHFTVLGLWLWGTLNPNSALFGKVTSVHSNDTILLTIDDGPDPDSTEKILTILKEKNIKAVFFIIGEQAQKHPELVTKIQNDGHLIGNHTQTHPEKKFWSLSPWSTKKEILHCQKVLTEITSNAPYWFRAPVGHSNLYVHPILRLAGLHLMGWNCRGYDASSRSLNEVQATLLPDIKSSAIILMHEKTEHVEELLLSIIKTAEQRDLKFVPLTEIKQHNIS